MNPIDGIARFHRQQAARDAKEIAVLKAALATVRAQLVALEREKDRHRMAAVRNRNALTLERERSRNLKTLLDRTRGRDFLSPREVA